MSEPRPTYAAVIRDAARQLEEAGSETPRLDADVLLRHLLELDRTELFLRLRDPLNREVEVAFQALVARRIAGEPIAFITGTREFMGLAFSVGPGVLVPRPETELLVEWAADWLRDRGASTVVDVGTGSGAIALSLATIISGSNHRIVGSDRSVDALRYASTNRSRFGLVDTVRFVVGDLLTWIRPPVDLILANLPYLRPDQLASNPDLRMEPELALVSGDDGLSAIRRLLRDIPRVMSPTGAVALEIDPSQVLSLRSEIPHVIPNARIDVLFDLAGLERVVIVETMD